MVTTTPISLHYLSLCHPARLPQPTPPSPPSVLTNLPGCLRPNRLQDLPTSHQTFSSEYAGCHPARFLVEDSKCIKTDESRQSPKSGIVIGFANGPNRASASVDWSWTRTRRKVIPFTMDATTSGPFHPFT